MCCPHFTDWFKDNVKTKGMIFHKAWATVIDSEEFKSEISVN